MLVASPALELLEPAPAAGSPAAAADESWVLRRGERVAARASLWHRHAPPVPGERLGLIGDYSADDAHSGGILLAHACRRLAALGCSLAVGPMDGSTWHPYRYVSWSSGEPPFFLEPSHPQEWVDHWAEAGFRTLANYHSTATSCVAAPAMPHRSLAAENGFRLRRFDPACWDDELRRIHTVASAAFQDNFLFTPLDEAGFRLLYEPLRSFLQPEFVLLADDDAGRTVGFLFALPDFLEPQRGATLRTLIVKTVGVLPGRGQAGLGRTLVAAAHEAAREAGLRRVIHALMHEGNTSRQLSARFASRPLRRYALLQRRLE